MVWLSGFQLGTCIKISYVTFPPSNFLWQNTQRIYYLNYVLVYGSVALNIFILWIHSSPELFSFCRTETLYLLNSNSRFSPSSPTPGNHHSTLCLYEFDYSISHKGNHTDVFLWLADFTWHKCPQGSSMSYLSEVPSFF